VRWPWQRRPQPATQAFDASIDLDLRSFPQADRARVIEAVRRRVGAIPGASWISVEPHAAGSVRVFAAGSGVEEDGPAWAALRERIAAAVQQAMPAPGGWGPAAEPKAQGFAEAMSPAQLDALAQLAVLAEISKQRPPPEPEPPPELDALAQLEALAKLSNKQLTPSAPATDDVGRLTTLLNFVLPADGRETAQAAVTHFGSYAAVLAAPEAELRKVRGLGTHCVAAIKLVHAAAVRLARSEVAAQPVLDDKQRLHDYLAAALAREKIEQFRILFLDESGMLKADEVQASGTVNHTPVYPREVVRRALALGAASVVLVHNHPSGDPAPSRDDIEMTRQVRAAAAVMSIAVRDHVIVGNGRWLSFRESGLLD